MFCQVISLLAVVCCVAESLPVSERGAAEESCLRLDEESGSCYYIVWKRGSWYDATERCRENYGGDLAMFETEQEWFQLVKKVKEKAETSGFEFWTGFTDEHLWIGAVTLDKHRSFIWYASAQKVPSPRAGRRWRAWDPWARAEPDGNADGTENCVAMDMRRGQARSGEPRMGQLNDKKCNQRLHGFVCEKRYDQP